MSKFYITTSIPYVNAPPHIGHALEFLQADVLARKQRIDGNDVFFLTGTDEHGAKICRAAEEAGKEPQAFVDTQVQQFDRLLQVLSISHDGTIRTSDKQNHWPGAQEMWHRINANGDIYKDMYKGLYCVGHEAFVTEKDLKDGVCEDHGKKPEKIEEENYFFRLSEYGEEIRNQIERGDLAIVPKKRANEVLSFLAEGAQDISFSRPAKDIPWGIPVPGDNSQTMYVWCDALSNYISALGFGTKSDEMFKTYWPADIHVIGKDIARFHAVIWPAMLLSAGLPLPKRIFVHGHIHSGGKKMSKSIGNVIDPFALVDRYGSEAVRYILLGNVSTFEDSDLTLERIGDMYTAHLANGLGNLVSRTTAMVQQYFEGYLSKPAEVLLFSVPFKTDIDILGVRDRDLEIGSETVSGFIQNRILPRYQTAWEEYHIDKALQEVMRLFHMLDGYIQDYEPFKLIKTDKERTQAILWNIVSALHSGANLLAPFLPETAESIAGMLGINLSDAVEEKTEYILTKKTSLFPRVE
jgi:methionyl-tRNA synthetase